LVNAASAAQSFPAELPTFSCEIKPLTREGLKTAKANRERFAKACLACIGDECAMRIWPAGYEDREMLCRNTYCLPRKINRTAFAEGYNMSYRYKYRINADGRSEVLSGEYLDGEPRGVTGKRTKEEHQELLRKVISKVQYEPIIIGGRAKSLVNLETVFEVGANYEE
jgi:hypothetical protein